MNITLHTLGTAPTGTTGLNLVQQVNPTGTRPYVTEASDALAAFVLHPAITDGASDPGVDGQVTIMSSMAAAGTSLPAAVQVGIVSAGQAQFPRLKWRFTP